MHRGKTAGGPRLWSGHREFLQERGTACAFETSQWYGSGGRAGVAPLRGQVVLRRDRFACSPASQPGHHYRKESKRTAECRGCYLQAVNAGSGPSLEDFACHSTRKKKFV